MRWGSALLRHASFIAAAAFHAFAPSSFSKQVEGVDFGRRRPHGKKSGRQRSGQKAGLDRLILDRSSTVKKMQRWLNNGTLHGPSPKGERHLMRHGWYRRQKQNEARAAAKEAWNA